jgi:hypothetical protein
MVKLTFEIWETGTGSAMFQRGSKGWKKSLTPPIRLLHTYQAETLYTAYQTYYDFMGWGRWKTDGIEDRVFTEEDIAAPDTGISN